MSLTQLVGGLVGILHIICRGRSLNSGHPNSLHLKCVSSNH